MRKNVHAEEESFWLNTVAPCAELWYSAGEYFVTVFDNKLHCGVLRMHVCHFAFHTMVSHNRGCKDDSKILGCHLGGVSKLLLNYDPQKREHTKFSLFRLATRSRWNIKNSRQSRCFAGSMLKVRLRWVHRSFSSSTAL